MKQILLEVPDEVLISLKNDTKEFSKQLLMLGAVKLYQMKKLSSGRAAQLAGMPRLVFLKSLAEYGVPVFDMNKEDLLSDIQNA